MIPLRLEIKNFLAYRSPDPLRFEGIHLACLTGPNGAGKSSVLDAITWALWGQARARDDELIHHGQNDMLVQLDFEQEGTVYRVLRKRARRSRSGTSTLDLYSIVDGQITTLSAGSMRETQATINRLLRMTHETFTQSALMGQGNADAFTRAGGADRKKVLSDILGLDQWSHYEEAAKTELKRVSAEVVTIQSRISEIDAELEQEPGLQRDVAEAEEAQREAAAALAAAETEQQKLAHAPADLRNARSAQQAEERRRAEYERDLQTVMDNIKRQESKLAGFRQVIENRDEIETGYAVLKEAREADTELADRLMQLSKFDQQRGALERSLLEERGRLESDIRGHQARIDELQRTIARLDLDELARVQTDLKAHERLEAEREQAQADLSDMEGTKGKLSSQNNTLRTAMNELKERLNQVEAIEGAECPLCGQPLTGEHRQRLIKDLQAEGKRMGDLYRANQKELDAAKDAIIACKAQIEALGQDVKRLAALRERAGALQQAADDAHQAWLDRTDVEGKLAALEGALANEIFGADIRQQLAILDAQREEVGYDRSSHDAARRQVQEFKAFEDRQRRLELALSALPDAEKALENERTRQERTTHTLEESAQSIQKLEEDISRLSAEMDELRLRNEEVNRLRTQERQQRDRLVAAQQRLKALDDQRVRRTELTDRLAKKRREESLLDDLKLAFGKKGVPAMIIEAAIPELEETANHHLRRMTDGRMSLRFSTQREAKSGESVIEQLEIEIADELGTRNYDLYSGGEAFRINFAIRVALSQMLARRAGAHLRTLFIDEGFGTQDDDGRNKLIEAITAVQDSFSLILAITHIDELRDSFPVHLMVEKTPSGSRVLMR